MSDPYETDGARATPPVEPMFDDAAESEGPRWPKVVGIVSICWASFGLLCGVCGIASLAFMPQMLKGAEQQFGPMPDVMKPDTAQLIVGAVGMIGPVLLLAAGIATVMRKPVGRILHIVYAITGFVLGVAGIALAVRHQLAVEAWAKANSADKWAPQAASPFAWVGIVFSVVLTLAWPVFCVLWFGVLGRRPETGHNPGAVI